VIPNLKPLCIDPGTGMAGDMFVAALIALGAPARSVTGAMERAGRLLGGKTTVCAETVSEAGMSGVRLRVDLETDGPHLEAERARGLLEQALAGEQLIAPYAEFARRVLEELLAAEREAHTGGITPDAEFRMTAVGTAHTPYSDTAPYQPEPGAPGEFYLDIFPNYAAGLAGLETFSHVYVLSYLHRSRGWSATVTPPWQQGEKRRRVGLFASRSPNRPSPIGITVTELRGVKGNRIWTGPMDLFDGTPVLDVKPYIRSLEVEAMGNDGWLADTEHLRLHKSGIPHRHGAEEAVLHEAADILLDIIGAATGLQALGVAPDSVACLTPVAVGGGTVACSHGVLPVPPPAVHTLLKRHRIPHVSGPADVELLTPTGAALLAALRPRWRARELGPPAPSLRSGHGFGTRKLEVPNVLTLRLPAAH